MTHRLHAPLERLAARIAQLEQIPVGPAACAAGFLAIVAVRHLLEIRSSQYPIYPPSAFYVHYVLAYLAPMLSLSMLLAVFARVSLSRVLRLMLLAWGLTLLPPLIDILTARAHDAHIGYLELGETPWTAVFMHFFDPTRPLKGTTPGIRIEAALACLLAIVYVGLRAPAGRVYRSLGAAVAVYVTSISFFTLPTLVLRALRLAFPGLTRETLFLGVGRVVRPSIEAVCVDQVSLIYLVPLSLILGALTLAMMRPDLLRSTATLFALSDGWGWATLCGFGAAAGWLILDGVPQPTPSAPFDTLACVAGVLALLLAGGALSVVLDGDARRAPPRSGQAACGVVLLLAAFLLAPAASTELASFAAVALGAGVLAKGIPRVVPWLALAPQAAAGIAALASFLAGYSLAGGKETLVIFPAPLLVSIFGVGFLADLPRAYAGPARGLALLCRATAAAAPIAALGVPLAALGGRPTAGTMIAAVLLSGVSLASVFALPIRIGTALPLIGAISLLHLSITDPVRTHAWRASALASPVYWIRLSQSAEAAGDLRGAAGAAGEALRRAPGIAAPHHRLALVRAKSNDMAGAIEEFRAAAALDPLDGGLIGNLALALLDTGAREEALSLFDRARALDPDRCSTLFNRARCLDALGRSAEAEAEWREYLQRAAGHPEEAASIRIARNRLNIP